MYKSIFYKPTVLQISKIAIAASLFSPMLHAGSMPYIGPDSANCKVVSPNKMSRIDAGFLTDEECTSIFVKPPSLGEVNVTSLINDHVDDNTCDSMLGLSKEVASLNLRIAKSDDSEERASLKSKLRMIRSLIDDEAVRYPSIAVKRNLVLENKWADLMKEYEELNPNMSVKRLEVRIGFLSTDSTQESSYSDITTEEPLGHFYRADFAAFKLDNAKEVIKAMGPYAVPFSGLFENMNNALLMGEKLAAQEKLGLIPGCRAVKNNKSKSTGVYGTYTYLYEVQTKASVSVSIDFHGLKNQLIQLAKNTKGDLTIDVEALKSSVKATGLVQIRVDNGLFNGNEAKDLEQKYKDELRTMLIEQYLAMASSTINSLRVSNTSIKSHIESKRVCRKKLFWKECRNERYRVNVAVVNWEMVQREFDAYVSNIAKSQASQYGNIFMLDTAAFVNSQNQERINE